MQTYSCVTLLFSKKLIQHYKATKLQFKKSNKPLILKEQGSLFKRTYVILQ